MPNIVGTRINRRLLIARVVKYILLYAVPVWARALNNTTNQRKVSSANRPTARILSYMHRIGSKLERDKRNNNCDSWEAVVIVSRLESATDV